MSRFFIILFIPLYIYAHSLLLNLIDNEDGTITIVGEFSTGESASGALIKLQAISTKEILFQKRLNDESEITIDIPKIAYNVILDGGPGHTISKKGIAPKGGFKKEEIKDTVIKPTITNTSSSSTLIILVSISIILFIATIFISIFNTNRLLSQLKK